MQEELKVVFQRSGRSVFVLPGTALVEAAGRAGVILQMPCGGRGTCGKCRVRIVAGATGNDVARHAALPSDAFEQGWRLGCQVRVTTPLTVEVPPESTFEYQQRILVEDSGHGGVLDPGVAKCYVELEPPTQADSRSDLTRLCAALGGVTVAPELVAALPAFLREQDWRGTAVLADGCLIGLEPDDTTSVLYGVAFDIGTTTVVGTLFDLVAGESRAVASEMNGQVSQGDDVLARILRIREDASALLTLQTAILDTIRTIIRKLCAEADVASRNIYEVTAAGNSTMQQILAGYDPSALGEVPFVQVFDTAQTLPAARLGLPLADGATVYLFPQVGGFVGGDTVAGVLAARLDASDGPALLVDIGTNGEIVLAHDGKLEATSTAAGPAFEGARIVQGMRASPGAVEKVVLDDEVRLNVIGNARPAGLCGTGLIDAVAELLRAGIVDSTGRILPAEELPAGLPDTLRDRIAFDAEGRGRFILAVAAESATGEDLCLWQKDIRELQLACGAIRAGIAILLRRAGLQPGELGTVLLAGAFGNFIRRRNACRIGLLPAVPHEAIRYIGNAASLGAKLALLSAPVRRRADALRGRIQHVDLSLDPEFQLEFGMAMLFPEDAD